MDPIELAKAAVYGVVEGVTEWLPISSTGHMLLLNQFLTMDVSEDFWNMFLVVIQLGAILAVCVMFFHRLNPFSPSKSAGEKRDTWSLWGKTIVACIPAAAIGIPIDDWMEANLGSPFVIAAALIVYGIAFIVIETVRGRRARALVESAPRHLAAPASLSTSELADADARVKTLDELDWKTAIGIGLFQVLSIVPGTSRSGSTIIGGLLLGCSRTVVAEFTFFRRQHVQRHRGGHPRHGVRRRLRRLASGHPLPDGLRASPRLQAVRLVPHPARHCRHRLVCPDGLGENS